MLGQKYIAIKTVKGLCKSGTIYEHTELGLEEVDWFVNPTGKREMKGYTGLILPFSALEDYLFPYKASRDMTHEHIRKFKRH
jgi:hypothetical protein